ncbi:MAG: hypothetical protein A2W80_00915 [Candidatus Riflebacteria bacterium GWC2_50_8]|nr:MAG: hypothetical protein A2W80_00915 [Candidatus Riflebacteria bacterium GWC2_50_8]
MGRPQRKRKDVFTYAEYKSWDDDERWEIIDGEAFAMTPGPGMTHQSLSVNLVGLMFEFFNSHPCKLFSAPFDVLLPESDETADTASNVVQPDIVVYFDPDKLEERGGIGAPDLAVEIISPTSARRDLIEKFALYERHGVREYWVVDPAHQILTIYSPDKKGKYTCEKRFSREHELTSHIFPELKIDLKRVFPEIKTPSSPSPSQNGKTRKVKKS